MTNKEALNTLGENIDLLISTDDKEIDLIKYANVIEALKCAIESLGKLDEIEQVINKWISLKETPNFCMMEIREVLEKNKN